MRTGWIFDANKLDDLEKMDKFLETYKLQILNYEEIKKKNLKTPMSKEIEPVIKNFSTNKTTGPDSFMGETTTHLKKN